MHKNQYVVRHGDAWAVRGENNKRVTRVVDTQSKAYEIAVEIARNQHAELLVQDKHGRFSVRNSYGNDPCPPKDKNR